MQWKHHIICIARDKIMKQPITCFDVKSIAIASIKNVYPVILGGSLRYSTDNKTVIKI